MKRFIALLLAMMMVFALCACGGDSDQADSEYVADKGTLVVGITNFAPMDYPDDNGEWIGFDADMAKAFAEYLGVDVEFVEVDWDNKIFELNSKSIDCVWNGMTLNDEVLNSMECGDAYCKNSQVIVVNADVADKYQTAESAAELKFAVEAGSAGEDAAKENSYDYTPVNTQADALMEVASGSSDAAIVDLLMAGALIGKGTSYPQLTFTVRLTEEDYGVGFRQGSDLAAKYNEFYAQACADGTVAKLAEQYGISDTVIIK